MPNRILENLFTDLVDSKLGTSFLGVIETYDLMTTGLPYIGTGDARINKIYLYLAVILAKRLILGFPKFVLAGLAD